MEIPKDVLRGITEYAFALAVDMLDEKPEYMSERAAKDKYKGLLVAWVQNRLITPIPTENGKHMVYSKRRLVQLHGMTCKGLI